MYFQGLVADVFGTEILVADVVVNYVADLRPSAAVFGTVVVLHAGYVAAGRKTVVVAKAVEIDFVAFGLDSFDAVVLNAVVGFDIVEQKYFVEVVVVPDVADLPASPVVDLTLELVVVVHETVAVDVVAASELHAAVVVRFVAVAHA